MGRLLQFSVAYIRRLVDLLDSKICIDGPRALVCSVCSCRQSQC